jgi:abortive infection bacteriophage resistance protein
MKRAKTLEEQIKILSDRGLILDLGQIKTMEILSDIGYFRLGFYCFPFETSYPATNNRTHQFKEGTKISDVIKLYYLDCDLRNILSKYINRIEINFRTNVIYKASNRYLDCNTWFANPIIVENDFLKKFDKRVYNEAFKRKPIIRRHHKKYLNDKYAPAWKTVEYFTFGSILKLFKNLKDDTLKLEIALVYDIHNVNILHNYFDSIREIRNICAHGGVLFDHTLAKALVNGPALKISNRNKNKLYATIQITLFVLSKISKNRSADMENEIHAIFALHKDDPVLRNIIERISGYNFIN